MGCHIAKRFQIFHLLMLESILLDIIVSQPIEVNSLVGRFSMLANGLFNLFDLHMECALNIALLSC
jgi:membrane protein CcdC involved in cytochrome C biogenesis